MTAISLPYIAVFLGVFSVSLSSIFFKFTSAEPLVVAFYRLAISAGLLAIPLLWKRNRIAMTFRDVWLSIVSGVFLAIHFGTWFFSLKLTSVASSTALVSVHPIIVQVYAYLTRSERPEGMRVAGVAITVLGAALVGWGDMTVGSNAVMGDMLAFSGAVAVGVYFLIGRHVRKQVSTIAYSTIVYTTSAVFLLGAAVSAGNPLVGFPPFNWVMFAALAMFPTILGHTLFNWALKYVPASLVSINILGEPIGATILAWIIWRTVPGPVSLIGCVVILLGIGASLVQRPETD